MGGSAPLRESTQPGSFIVTRRRIHWRGIVTFVLKASSSLQTRGTKLDIAQLDSDPQLGSFVPDLVGIPMEVSFEHDRPAKSATLAST